MASMPVELWDHIMGVNARGTMLMCKHALPRHDRRRRRVDHQYQLRNFDRPATFFATAYAASKGAINTFTRYVATQYGSQGIRCNALVLGLIATPVLKRVMPEPLREIFRDEKLIGRLGEPRDVAEMVVFLASDRSSFITGQLLPVDGGFYAHTPTTVPMALLLAQMMARRRLEAALHTILVERLFFNEGTRVGGHRRTAVRRVKSRRGAGAESRRGSGRHQGGGAQSPRAMDHARTVSRA